MDAGSSGVEGSNVLCQPDASSHVIYSSEVPMSQTIMRHKIICYKQETTTRLLKTLLPFQFHLK